MRTIQIISGFEISDTQKHLNANGYVSTQQMLEDLAWAQQVVLNTIKNQQSQDKKTEIDFNKLISELSNNSENKS